jgi:hypothetical protein
MMIKYDSIQIVRKQAFLAMLETSVSRVSATLQS